MTRGQVVASRRGRGRGHPYNSSPTTSHMFSSSHLHAQAHAKESMTWYEQYIPELVCQEIEKFEEAICEEHHCTLYYHT